MHAPKHLDPSANYMHQPPTINGIIQSSRQKFNWKPNQTKLSLVFYLKNVQPRFWRGFRVSAEGWDLRNCKLNSANIKKFQKSQLSLRMNSLLSVASPFNSASKGFCYSYSRSHHLFGSKGMTIVLGKHLRSKFLVQDQKRQPQDVYGNAKYRIETQFHQLYCSCLGNLQYTINSHEVKIGDLCLPTWW